MYYAANKEELLEAEELMEPLEPLEPLGPLVQWNHEELTTGSREKNHWNQRTHIGTSGTDGTDGSRGIGIYRTRGATGTMQRSCLNPWNQRNHRNH